MSTYKIKKLQEQKAKALGFTIKPSTRKTKKLDVTLNFELRPNHSLKWIELLPT